MEHLTRFSRELPWVPKKAPKLPFHGYDTQKIFTSQDFYTIPGRYAKTLRDEGLKIISNSTPELDQNLPRFVQSWMFFGLLALFLDEDVDPLHFTREGSRYLTTENLPGILLQWKQKVQASPGPQQSTLAWKIKRALETASHFISSWHRDTHHVPSDSWLSVAILGETLTHAAEKIWPSQGSGHWHITDAKRWGESEKVSALLKLNGWCPSMTRRLQHLTGGLSGPYVTGCLSAPNDLHERCTSLSCEAFLDYGAPVHTNACIEEVADGIKANCPLLDAPIDGVMTTLERGEIPVMYVSRREKRDQRGIVIGEEYIEIVGHIPTNPETLGYVAISHVWADGLGNPSGNALPLCQLLEIQAMVNQVYGDGYGTSSTPFWLDTICVPVRPPTSRDKGLHSMGLVYTCAKKVLVLDNDLRVCEQLEGLEPLIRINMSKWASRLWTLQEGSLSRDLNFQFGGGRSIDIKTLEDRLKKAEEDIHLSWLKQARIFNPAMESLRNPDIRNKVTYIWQAVNDRRTSKTEDETICLSTLLGIDPQPLRRLGQNAEARMCGFLSMLDSHGREPLGIPAGMIFLQGSRLEKEGFRWAPQSWMDGHGQRFPYPMNEGKAEPAYLMPRGLLVKYPGIGLPLTRKPKEREITVCTGMGNDGSEQWYKVKFICESKMLNGHEELAPWSVMEDDDLPNLAVVLCRLKFQTDPEIALLVSIVSERGCVKWVHRLCNVWVTSITDPIELDKVQRSLITHGEVCPGTLWNEQNWCVDGRPVRIHSLIQRATPLIVLLQRKESASIDTDIPQTSTIQSCALDAIQHCDIPHGTLRAHSYEYGKPGSSRRTIGQAHIPKRGNAPPVPRKSLKLIGENF